VSFVKSLVEYTKQLKDKGTASHVVQQTGTLHDRATELVTLGVLEEAVGDLGTIDVTFIPASLSAGPEKELIGRLIRFTEGGKYDY